MVRYLLLVRAEITPKRSDYIKTITITITNRKRFTITTIIKYQTRITMKYLKKVLLATTLVASSLGMSMSANAGAIIQQDIIADIFFAHPDNTLGMVEGVDQVLGYIKYNTDHVEDGGTGFLLQDSSDLELEVNFGFASFTLADGAYFQDGSFFAALNPADPFAGLEDLAELFFDIDYDISLNVGALDNSFLAFDLFGVGAQGEFADVEGTTRFGDVTYVPEPSVLALMLGGLVLVARRRAVK